MDTVQFYHNRSYNESTTAVDIKFTRQEILDLFLSEHDTLVLNVGTAKKHPNDQYCKKTGREVSRSKMKLVTFKVHCAYKNLDCFEISLLSEEYSLLIKISNKSDKPHLIHVSR